VPKLLAIAQRIPALAGDVQAMAGAALTGLASHARHGRHSMNAATNAAPTCGTIALP
jgi:hypothetical protein